jgi:hypothetical protein
MWCGQCALGVTGRLLKKIQARQLDQKLDSGSKAAATAEKEKEAAEKKATNAGADAADWDFTNPEIKFWNSMDNARQPAGLDSGFLEVDSTEMEVANDGRLHVTYGPGGGTIDQLSRDAARLFAHKGVRVHQPRYAAEDEWPHGELAALLETGKFQYPMAAAAIDMKPMPQVELDAANGNTIPDGGRSDIQNIPGGPGWDDGRKEPIWHQYAGYKPGTNRLPQRSVPETNSDDAKDNFMAMLNAQLCLHGPGVQGPATTAQEQLADALFSAFLKQDNVEPKCFIPGLSDRPTLPPTSMYRSKLMLQMDYRTPCCSLACLSPSAAASDDSTTLLHKEKGSDESYVAISVKGFSIGQPVIIGQEFNPKTIARIKGKNVTAKTVTLDRPIPAVGGMPEPALDGFTDGTSMKALTCKSLCSLHIFVPFMPTYMKYIVQLVSRRLDFRLVLVLGASKFLAQKVCAQDPPPPV